nr:unnamed protein product [Callosobruchus chinensis]
MFQVSLHTSFNDEFFCGGIAISNNTVLTAGQCLYYDWGGQMPPIVVRVHTGTNNLNEVPLSRYEVSEILYHPKFNKMAVGNNLALLRINTKFPADNRSVLLDHISLTESFSNSNITEHCTVVGWNKATRDLRAVDVNVVNCSIPSPNTICIQSVDTNGTMCNVSLGSSLLCDDRLAGILTMQSHCNASSYTRFENVLPVKEWLLTNGAKSHKSLNILYIGLCSVAFHFINRVLITT